LLPPPYVSVIPLEIKPSHLLIINEQIKNEEYIGNKIIKDKEPIVETKTKKT